VFGGPRLTLAKARDSIWKISKAKKRWRTQVVEHLFSKNKGLSSKPQYHQKEKVVVEDSVSLAGC
jgi:hypothetical protein